MVGSANGFHTDRPSGVKIAYDKIVKGDDTLDAIIAGVNTQELDPDDMSVGYGGLPNAEGVVQLDSSCMHGPTKRAGAVGGLEGIATPSLVAKAVMDYTDHIFSSDWMRSASRWRWDSRSRTCSRRRRRLRSRSGRPTRKGIPHG